MPAPNLKAKHWDTVVEMARSGATQDEVAEVVGVAVPTISKWAKSEPDFEWPKGNRGRYDRIEAGTRVEVECRHCGTTFTAPRYTQRRFCSRDCTNQWQRERVEMVALTCEGCGIEFEVYPSDAERRKFCTKACANKHQRQRQPDPSNYVTFTCETCGEEATKYHMGGKRWRFCSNECAHKHTKVVRHYVVREMDMVLDSTWEMLFAGLCGYLKIPVERFDREDAIEVETSDGKTRVYGPDFFVDLDGVSIAVEVKGYENDEFHEERWAAWREAMGPLVVVDEALMDDLRAASDRGALVATLLEHAFAETLEPA